MNNQKIYCISCKKHTKTNDMKIIKCKNNRLRNTGVCLNCGTNKSQFRKKDDNVEGEGFISDVQDFINERTIEAAPDSYIRMLKKAKQRKIVHIEICRKALSKALHNLLDTFNEKKLKEVQHDVLYHLFGNFKLDDGTWMLVEKNQRLNTVYNKRRTDQTEKCIQHKLNKPIDVNKFFDNAVKLYSKLYGGQKWYFRYSADKHNCQRFLSTILKANGINKDEYIMQDVKELIQDTPIESIINTATDVGAFKNWFVDDVLLKNPFF